MKNRYKVTFGKSRQVIVVARNVKDAFAQARALWNIKAATLKCQYLGHA